MVIEDTQHKIISCFCYGGLIDMDIAELLFHILRSEVDNTPVDPALRKDNDPKELYRIAKKHDLLYCVFDALYKADMLPEDKTIFDTYTSAALVETRRMLLIEDAFEKINKALNEAEIPFVPLKGARIRSMYPNPMTRASCDIDILVKEEQLEQAISALESLDFTTDRKRNYHDVSLYYGKIHLELHFNICENMDDIDALLKCVWEYVEPVSQYKYHEKPEFFIFHHIAHMKYHFMNGGCGIRPFLDLYVMRKKDFYDEENLTKLLDQVSLKTFYQSILQVISVWFEDAPHTELTKKCEEYILHGGVYGSSDNSIAVNSAVHNGKLKNLLRLIFPNYEIMCVLYPNLMGHKYLLPLYYLKRMFAKSIGKNREGTHKKVKDILFFDKEKINTVNDLLQAMGVK